MSETEVMMSKFEKLDTSFKNGVYHSFTTFIIHNFDILKQSTATDKFPNESFVNIQDRKEVVEVHDMPARKNDPNTVINGKIPKSIAKIKSTAVNKKKMNLTPKNKEEELTPKIKSKSKTNPISLNKHTKLYLDFIVNRFLWEIYSIDDNVNIFDETFTPSEIVGYISEKVSIKFTKGNITELMVSSISAINPDGVIKENYHLYNEIRYKFDIYISNLNLNHVASIILTKFIKLLAIMISNQQWYSKTKTVDASVFEIVLNNLYLTVSNFNYHSRNQILHELSIYSSLHNGDTEDSEVKKNKLPKENKDKSDTEEYESDNEYDSDDPNNLENKTNSSDETNSSKEKDSKIKLKQAKKEASDIKKAEKKDEANAKKAEKALKKLEMAADKKINQTILADAKLKKVKNVENNNADTDTESEISNQS
jgi:hypothetical protein